MPTDLKHGSVKKTGLGLPHAISGGFALTFEVTASSKRFAVRCFHRHSPDIEQRYAAIDRFLRSHPSPYFVGFEFVPGGIRVKGATYPIVRMEWVEGSTLGVFLHGARSDRQKVEWLASELRQLAAFLEQRGMAHGDIQPGNIIVTDKPSLKLIDYDGMYVPELRDVGTFQRGHVNFQHPERSRVNEWNERLDRFSFLVMDVALRALAVDPGLWTATQSDADAFLLRGTDFQAPSSSGAFQLLAMRQALTRDAEALAAVCEDSISQVPRLQDFGRYRRRSLVPHPGMQVVRPPYIGPYQVVDGANFDEGLHYVGTTVELIGKVTSVKRGRASHGGPYVFVNFGDWRSKCMKINIWTDALDKLAPGDVPDESWKGRWLSVKGLIDPPYSNPRYGPHLSITLSGPGAVSVLPEDEALFRLQNRRAHGRTQPTSSPRQQGMSSRNAKIAEEARRRASRPSTTRASPHHTSAGRRRTPPASARHKPAPAQRKPAAPPSGGCLLACLAPLPIWVIAIMHVLREWRAS